MSAEAGRRLEEDLRYLESVNVWHLVNLRPPSESSHTLYHPSTYSDRLDVISPSMTQLGTYSPQNFYNSHSSPPSYLEDPHKYHNGTPTPPISAGVGTSLPYPDLILHTTRAVAPEVVPRERISQYNQSENTDGDFLAEKYNLVESLDNLIPTKYNNNNIIETRDFSPVIQNSLPLKETPHLKHLSLLPNEPEDYDEVGGECSPDHIAVDDKKCVSFTPDTVFVERDMDTPFWKAFTERRRIRRIHRQRKQLNQQIANATNYQPSLLEIVKSAFSSGSKSSGKDNNGNCTKSHKQHHHHNNQSKKGEVLVYDNSSQIPEKYTAQYVYSAPPSRSHKLFQMISCQCCSSSSSPPSRISSSSSNC